jgi:hypothetical protein
MIVSIKIKELLRCSIKELIISNLWSFSIMWAAFTLGAKARRNVV